MENLVFNELRRQGFNVDVGLVESFGRNADGKTVRSNLEVDFVVNKADERIYIQSAYMLPNQEKVEQEQASLLHIPDGFKKMIIVGDRYNSNFNEDGIQIVGIFDFLLGNL
jgi:Predicted ATPase (AAA+ superfamily)